MNEIKKAWRQNGSVYLRRNLKLAIGLTVRPAEMENVKIYVTRFFFF